MTADNHFPGFAYPASALLKFLAASELFTIMLKTGEVIHFTAKDAAHFRRWLLEHHVIDIRQEKVRSVKR